MRCVRKADERTSDMTREEYVTWSEYRQASFTYRKGKRFREWAGFGIVTVLTLIAAGVMGWLAMSEFSSQRHMPRTMDTLKENFEWMRARTS